MNTEDKNKIDNLIPFPGNAKEKVEVKDKVESKKHLALPVSQFFKRSQNVALAAGVVGIFLFSTLMNQTLFYSGTTNMSSYSDQRDPDAVGVVSRDVEGEHSLASKLAKSSVREPASIGYKASLEEDLRYGQLEGKFQVQFQEGKIKEANLAGTHEAQLAPPYAGDRKSFIQKYARLFPGDVSEVEKISSYERDSVRVENYDLKNGDDEIVGEVEFELDPSERLLSLKVLEKGN